MQQLSDSDVEAYLARLGLDVSTRIEVPSIAGLRHLHAAHVDRVSYETLWIHLGEQRGIEPPDSVHEVAKRGRGGYCFQLNGAFSALLATLGYRVTRHLGAVHNADTPPNALGNHMVLLAHDLPDDSNPGGTWYVDVGLGDGLTAPMPLAAGAARQAPFTVALRPSPWPMATWSFVHDSAGSFPGMVFSDSPVDVAAFAADHLERVRRRRRSSPPTCWRSAATAPRCIACAMTRSHSSRTTAPRRRDSTGQRSGTSSSIGSCSTSRRSMPPPVRGSGAVCSNSRSGEVRLPGVSV
jgi:N-acetyltransferase